VYCRVRPSLSSNDVSGNWQFDDSSVESKTIKVGVPCESADGRKQSTKEYNFAFDRVFAPSTPQSAVFDEVSHLIQSACDGYHVCIFAYGQTSSGKTFTMEGPESGMDSDTLMGIIPRSMLMIWDHAQNLKSKGWDYEMTVSFLEIYNESINDLLAKDTNGQYEIKHDLTKKETVVAGAEVVKLTCANDALKLLHQAKTARKVAATNCNERSSRSHR
jgi:kinesin family protein C1